jgi:hypothetical protein
MDRILVYTIAETSVLYIDEIKGQTSNLTVAGDVDPE